MTAQDLDRLAAERHARGLTVPLGQLIEAILLGLMSAIPPGSPGPSRLSRRDPVSHIYISPSTREGSTFSQAYQGVKSPEMSALIDALPTGQTGYGVWSDGAEEVRHAESSSREAATAAALTLGQRFKQKAVLVFHEGHGSDILHKLHVPHSDPERIYRDMSEHGIQFATILPHAGESEVHVADPKGQSAQAVADYARRAHARHEAIPGQMDEINTRDTPAK